MFWPLALEFVFTLGCVMYVYNVYASFKKQPWYVTASVIFGWWISFGVVFLLTVDLTANNYDNCVRNFQSNSTTTHNHEDRFDCVEPLSYVNKESLIAIWAFIYWMTQALCWLIYPLLQSYYASAEFHYLKRVWRAIKEQLIFYAIAGVVGGAFAIYFIVRGGMKKEDLMGTAILIANTFGLVTLILLLGFGLVEVPRNLWRSANRSLTLKHHYYRIAEHHRELEEAKLNFDRVLRSVKQASEDVPSSDPYRVLINKIIDEAPEEYNRIYYAEGDVEITYSSLVNLRGQVLNSRADVHRAQALLDQEITTAIELQDIISSVASKERVVYSQRPPRTGRFSEQLDRLEFIWVKYLETITLRVLCVLCVILSVMTVWSEGTFFVPHPVLSIFAKLVNIPDLPNFLLQSFITIPLGYIMICCYYSMFRFRMFNIYRLIPHQETDPYSMLLCGMLISRQIGPLAYNYLLLLHRGKDDPETWPAFLHVMAAMNSVYGSLEVWINNGIPVLIVALCLISFFNLGDRMMALFKVKRFKFSEDWSDSQIDEGRDILERERTARESGIARERRLEQMQANRTQPSALSRPRGSAIELTSIEATLPRVPSASSISSLPSHSVSTSSLTTPSAPPTAPTRATSTPALSSVISTVTASTSDTTPSYRSGIEDPYEDDDEEVVVEKPKRGFSGLWNIFSKIKSPSSRAADDDMELLERSKALMSSSARHQFDEGDL
eukprot:TRINITY_DN4154_c0_g1_i2.p1 TRINITY_DN4154_c0_g1~~TRINITY_DN4154_c0_g1_i2.p1  ORF type:complete len:723 (-),score=119.19 TRINITY_DN4154_c0_g1_i2:44-2212(-)